MDYVKQYKNNRDFFESNKYDEYIKILGIIYENFGKCPENSKIDAKIFENEKILDILCLGKKDNMRITVEKPQFINLYNKFNSLQKELENIINDILINIKAEVINQDNFIELKNKYNSIIKEINNLSEIFIDQKQELNQLENDHFNINKDLEKLYLNRTEIFSKINKISYYKMKQLLDFYKKNGSDNSTQKIFDLSKVIEVPQDQIKLWFEWFNISTEYIKLQNDLINIIQRNNKIIDINNIIFNYFYLKEPKIIQTNNKDSSGKK